MNLSPFVCMLGQFIEDATHLGLTRSDFRLTKNTQTIYSENQRVDRQNKVMEVTSAVHSVGFLHLQKHLQRLNNGDLFFSTRPRKVKVPLPCHHHLHPIYSSSAKVGSSDRTSVVINSTSVTSTATEVEKIKQRCLTWQWKGQYSINYFVSSDSPQQSQSNHPALLLVHGFGASIPHWRRQLSHHNYSCVQLFHFSCCCFLVHPFFPF